MSGMFWIARELSIPKIGLNIMQSLTVKKLNSFKFNRVAESDNTGHIAADRYRSWRAGHFWLVNRVVFSANTYDRQSLRRPRDDDAAAERRLRRRPDSEAEERIVGRPDGLRFAAGHRPHVDADPVAHKALRHVAEEAGDDGERRVFLGVHARSRFGGNHGRRLVEAQGCQQLRWKNLRVQLRGERLQVVAHGR